MPEHLDIIQHAWSVDPPEKTLAGALEFLLQVIDVLPVQERAGLLLKPGGENIVPYKGQLVSAGRICYPDGRIYKILTDVPTGNGPSWHNDGTVDPARYLAVTHEPPPPPPPPPPDDDVAAKIAALTARVEATLALLQALHDRPFPDYTAPIPALGWPISMPAGTLVLKPRT